MKNRIKLLSVKLYYFFTLMIIGSSISCESFVDIDLPNNQLTGEIVFEDPSTVEAALLHIYARLRDNTLISGNILGAPYLTGLYSDELTLFGSSEQQELFYNNTLTPSTITVSSFWNSGYNLVYAANRIIEGVNASNSLTENEKNLFLGEAHFIRAFIHFYLVNLYGNIPYIETSNYTLNSEISRLDVDDIYQKLINDLILSKSLLSDQYIGPHRVRPNKWTASAFLARVYLYANQWDLALNEANGVISNVNYSLNPNLSEVFLRASTETIWQLDSGAQGANTEDGQTYIFNSGPPPNSSLSTYLVNSFELNDGRLSNWVGMISDGNETWYHANKYKLNTITPESQEFSIVLRLAEMYLIAAEAHLQVGNISNALSNLNIIKNRANLTSLETSDSNEVLDAIYEERKIEFFTEMAHRFFDLKRSNRIDETLSLIKPNWNSTDILLPIPESELILNPNLRPQNDGY